LPWRLRRGGEKHPYGDAGLHPPSEAQPVTLAHHLLAYVEMFIRDMDRLSDCKKRMDVLPLGAGALAGSTYPLDREAVARELGFSAVSRKSQDSVSDRDFCIEYCACASMVIDASFAFLRGAVLWSSDEFRFVEIDDAYSTGSSIMPKEKRMWPS
jgi:argininosuccinate lyase